MADNVPKAGTQYIKKANRLILSVLVLVFVLAMLCYALIMG